MTTQRYSVNPHPISSILAWIRDGDIAIPEIQRPFVWDATKVRNLLDSLYEGEMKSEVRRVKSERGPASEE